MCLYLLFSYIHVYFIQQVCHFFVVDSLYQLEYAIMNIKASILK